MPTLTVRDVPEDLHAWIKRQADTHHRSVNKEVIALLDELRGESASPRPRASADEILSIARRVAHAPALDERGPDETLGYDEDGLPT